MEKDNLNPPERDWPWIDGRAVMKLLGISSDALKKMRQAEKITCTQWVVPRGKYYYNFNEMKDQMCRNIKPSR